MISTLLQVSTYSGSASGERSLTLMGAKTAIPPAPETEGVFCD